MVWEKLYTLREAARQPFVRERLPFFAGTAGFLVFLHEGAALWYNAKEEKFVQRRDGHDRYCRFESGLLG